MSIIRVIAPGNWASFLYGKGVIEKEQKLVKEKRGDTISWLRFQCMTVQVWTEICLFFTIEGCEKSHQCASTSKHDGMITSSSIHNSYVYRTMREAVADVIACNSCI